MDLPCVPVALSFGSFFTPTTPTGTKRQIPVVGFVRIYRSHSSVAVAVAVAVAAAATQIREAGEMEIANLHCNGELGV
ncbi:hypothetical protein BHM03_00042085 [Ensete ventricosum]|nr:hypothetical protein BHM03_00042085 [Ensete ventricosum]